MPLRFKIPINYDLDLDSTLDGGQSFNWRSGNDGVWLGLIENLPVKLSIDKIQSGSVVKAEYKLSPAQVDLDRLKLYLDLDTPYEAIRNRLNSDSNLKSVIKSIPKFNILNQDPWQTLVSFIVSTQSNIPRIKRNLEDISIFGKNLVTAFGLPFYKFPNPHELAAMGENKLRALGLGYRAKNLGTVASLISENSFNIKIVSAMSYDDAKQYLMTLPGVGPKVADCVLAFSMGHTSAFPVDRWVSRGVKRMYSSTLKYSDPDISNWGREKFGDDAAYVQQMIFYYERWVRGRD
tara:strand:+ start:1967 stop:2842 length:876 start_codon:yes stop_codon:yes gene_type:complete